MLGPLPSSSTIIPCAEFVRYRTLVAYLAWRDLRVRYAQSMLGIAWAVAVPASMMLVFTFVFAKAFPALGSPYAEIPYALFAYTGLVPWTFFNAGLAGCMNSLVANRNLITKVYFPRELLPLSAILSAFFDFLIAWGVLALLLTYFAINGSFAPNFGTAALFFPVVVALQILLIGGLGLMLAAANLFFRDVRQIYSVGIQLLLFVSGVVVPLPRDDSWSAAVLVWNPLVPLMGAYRETLLFNRLPDLNEIGYTAAVSGFLFLAGWIVFRRASWTFAERI